MLRNSFCMFRHFPGTFTTRRCVMTTNEKLPKMLPKEIVKELDRFIVGQCNAKKAVALALHNRWRREMLSEDLKKEIHPKNILMIGPTGVGKTEIARRLAKICNAPFIKVEATKYTETGYHGSDVDSIIKDLVNVGIAQKKKILREQNMDLVHKAVEDKIFSLLIGEFSPRWENRLRSMLRDGALDDLEISIPFVDPPGGGEEESGGERIQLLSIVGELGGGIQKNIKWETRSVEEAREWFERQELDQLSEQRDEEIIKDAIKDVQERGIVFIDEIDKICCPKDSVRTRGDASDEGVQRDLLPLIEGTMIETKFGEVDTGKILFITSGAFYSAKPKDILPELQGRLPIRVSLSPLSENDMYRILTEPEYNLIKQQIELMKTEQMEITFPEDSVREIARLATEINRSVENIGARRLHTIIEKIMEEISFNCEKGKTLEISIPHIQQCVKPMLEKADTTRYII